MACLLIFSKPGFCQSQTIEGFYELETQSGEANIKRTLTLNADGTFLFYAYEFHERGIPQEKHIYAKGIWWSDKNIVFFETKPSDINDKYTLNFSTTKARFKTKSPRDRSNRVIKTSILIYESDVFWLKGLQLIKKNSV